MWVCLLINSLQKSWHSGGAKSSSKFFLIVAFFKKESAYKELLPPVMIIGMKKEHLIFIKCLFFLFRSPNYFYFLYFPFSLLAKNVNIFKMFSTLFFKFKKTVHLKNHDRETHWHYRPVKGSILYNVLAASKDLRLICD
jgi:hypothetical protein